MKERKKKGRKENDLSKRDNLEKKRERESNSQSTQRGRIERSFI